jgi:molybdopterin synthase sulfur carrier subunit
MKVHILAFGITKDIVGGSTFELQMEEGANVRQLKKDLQQHYPAFKDLASLAIAVNNEYASEELVIKASDEIVLIPPVSGG